MTRELVRMEVSRGVGTITLDSPHNRNALSRQLVGDLDRHLTAALDDPRVRVIVLTGAGSAFCSGADLKGRRGAHSTAPPGRPGGIVPILAAIWDAPKPGVGRINGPARAGGVGLVAACDIAPPPQEPGAQRALERRRRQVQRVRRVRPHTGARASLDPDIAEIEKLSGIRLLAAELVAG